MNQITKPRSLFLNLTQDLMFKNYFKLNKNVLKSLLKAFLPLPQNSSIKDIIILDSLIPSLSSEEKSSLMDLRVQLDSGEFVNVEMQAFPYKSFTKRILLYWAKNYSSQIKTGEKYEKLCPAYSLIFSTFDVFSKTKNFYTSFSICSDEAPYFSFTGDLRFVTVELSKFGKRKPSSLIDLREEWCYLLKESRRMGEKEGKELSRKGYEMEEAMFHLKELSREEGLRLVEEAREKAWKDQMAREDDSFGRGMAKRQQDLVISMLKNKLEISLISKITGLSAVEINKLKESLS
ncbi:MAG: Rpn family recombination-promoting nuclease/putative transposase [Bdellovibrionales bacterium]|nr:Rpn family recombination-promoting nuclease/putative transposase [Bdellovibrionales bacterium]